MINRFDQKHLRPKPRATSLSNGHGYKETNKKTREKT